MLKPNYQFEKRQREQEKKKKKAEKALRKQGAQEPGPDADAGQPGDVADGVADGVTSGVTDGPSDGPSLPEQPPGSN